MACDWEEAWRGSIGSAGEEEEFNNLLATATSKEERRAMLFCVDSDGCSALHGAACGDESSMRLLLEHTHSAKEQSQLLLLEDGSHRTALHYAAVNGSTACAQMLLQHARDHEEQGRMLATEDLLGKTALEEAERHSRHKGSNDETRQLLQEALAGNVPCGTKSYGKAYQAAGSAGGSQGKVQDAKLSDLEATLKTLLGRLVEKDAIATSLNHIIEEREERISRLEAEKEEGQRLAKQREERISELEAEREEGQRLAKQREERISGLEAEKEAEIEKCRMKLKEEVARRRWMVASVERAISEWRKCRGSRWFGDADAPRALEEIEAVLASSRSSGTEAVGGRCAEWNDEEHRMVGQGVSGGPSREASIEESMAEGPEEAPEEAEEATRVAKRRCFGAAAGALESS